MRQLLSESSERKRLSRRTGKTTNGVHDKIVDKIEIKVGYFRDRETFYEEQSIF